MSEVDEWVALSPLKVPKRDRASTIDHRSAAQNGQYSAPMKRISGFPLLAVSAVLAPVDVGAAVALGSPMADSVVGLTDVTSANTPAGSAEVPALVAAELPAGSLEAAGVPPDPPVALTITRATTASTTRATGTSAAVIGCRLRKPVIPEAGGGAFRLATAGRAWPVGRVDRGWPTWRP